MKYFKNIIAILILIGIFHMSYSAELSVENIQVVDMNTLNVTLSENPNLEVGNIEAEIRVLNDVKMRAAILSEEDTMSVEILLEDPLLPDTNYSLLTVVGSEGSIDFTTPSSVEGFEVANVLSSDEQNIDTFEVIDDRTLFVTYRQSITSSTLEYKLLAESIISSVEKKDFYLPDITITVDPPLSSQKDYILMFIEMQDAAGEYLEFDTGIYNFSTSVFEEGEETKNIPERETQEEIVAQEDELVVEENNLDTQDSLSGSTSIGNSESNEELGRDDSEEIDLQAAGMQVDSQDTEGNKQVYMNQVAGSITETPDAGAETWMLIIATLVINSFYYLSRRKKRECHV